MVDRLMMCDAISERAQMVEVIEQLPPRKAAAY